MNKYFFDHYIVYMKLNELILKIYYFGFFSAPKEIIPEQPIPEPEEAPKETKRGMGFSGLKLGKLKMSF